MLTVAALAMVVSEKINTIVSKNPIIGFFAIFIIPLPSFYIFLNYTTIFFICQLSSQKKIGERIIRSPGVFI